MEPPPPHHSTCRHPHKHPLQQDAPPLLPAPGVVPDQLVLCLSASPNTAHPQAQPWVSRTVGKSIPHTIRGIQPASSSIALVKCYATHVLSETGPSGLRGGLKPTRPLQRNRRKGNEQSTWSDNQQTTILALPSTVLLQPTTTLKNNQDGTLFSPPHQHTQALPSPTHPSARWRVPWQCRHRALQQQE